MRRETRAIMETVSEEGLGKTGLIFNKNPQIEGERLEKFSKGYEAPLLDRHLSPQSAPLCCYTSVLLLILNPC